MRDIHLYNIQLMDLELFLTATKCGSFTRTGEIMFLSQSWVSKRISLMEHELGLQLFIRNNRKLTLTPAGAILAQRLDSITDSIQEALQEAHNTQKGYIGSLKLGFLDWSQNPFLEKIRDYMDSHPQILLNIYFQQFCELKDHLVNNRADMIFTISYDVDEFHESEYYTVPISKIPLIAYVSIMNPLSKRGRIRVEDLCPEPILMLERNTRWGYSKYINELFAARGITPLVCQYASSGRAHIGNILLNQGILLASWNFLGDTYSDSIVALEVEDAELYLTVTWKKQNTNPAIHTFLQEVTGIDFKEAAAR